ncbi:hypothetical protein LJR030_002951 [Rhizobium sp. LjRoot30]|uniref:hypothetical protein n=1 Tax=Rhizobium sp. LjRoot30 TaxID=3342320 RepID=UPI003ECF92DC
MMTENMFPTYHTPLTSADLETCQAVLTDLCHAEGISAKSEKALEVAALIMELYRQGVHTRHTLAKLASTKANFEN